MATVPASPGRDTNAGRRCCAAHAATAEEKLCHIVLDYDSELKDTAESSDKEKTFELPDGNINTVDDTLPLLKSIFPTKFIGKAIEIYDTYIVLHHDPSDRRAHGRGDHCVGTIYGGIKMVAPPARKFSVRIWRSTWSSLRTCQQMWASR